MLSFFDSFNSGLSSFLNSTFYSLSSLGSSLLGSLVSLKLASEDSVELHLQRVSVSFLNGCNTELCENGSCVSGVQGGVNDNSLFNLLFNLLNRLLSVTASCEHSSSCEHKHYFLHFSLLFNL